MKNSIKNYKTIFGNIEISMYAKAALKYLPPKIKVLFIAESPPYFDSYPNWSYFYREDNPRSNLFRDKMSVTLYDQKFDDPTYFLSKFRDDGYFLMDAVEYPINKFFGDDPRVKVNKQNEVYPKIREDIIIEESFISLIKRIKWWTKKSGRSRITEIKIILIKVPVYNSLMLNPNPFKEMVGGGYYNVINRNSIPFPMPPHDTTFIREIRYLLELAY